MEQDTVKVVKRTTGLVLILAVVAGFIGILLWFFGSPWGASDAQKAVQAYVAQTYPDQGLEVEKAEYRLSTRGYQARVEDKEKEDVFFTVSVKDGQILSDSYETDVIEKGNTVRRLEEAYTALVQEKLEEAELSVAVRPSVRLDSASLEKVQLGMAFSLEDTLQYSLMLEGTADEPTLDTAAQLLGEVYSQMDAKGYGFSSYGVQLEKDGVAIVVAQVAPAQIKGGNLARILQLALEGDVESGVYISIREPEDGFGEESEAES